MSKFLRLKCACGNEQNVYAHASRKVNCLVCGVLLCEPTGSRVIVTEGTKVLKVLS